jgi:hypothetical protein
MSTSLCIARVFDDHRSCQKLINYITNIRAKSKRHHWIQKIPVLKRLFIQNFCKRSRCLEERRYKWHCCLLLFLAWLITESVYTDAFRTFTFSMQQCIVYITKKIKIILINFRFQIGNDRQSKRLHVLANLGRIIFFSFFFG